MSLDTSEPTTSIESPHEVINATYLPFTPAQLSQHFACVRGGGDPSRQLAHYLDSALRTEKHVPVHAERIAMARPPMCDALDHQIEKDERFWIATALMTAFHHEDRVGMFSRLLEAALDDSGLPSEFGDWAAALGPADELRLFFEANLPAPREYKDELAEESRGDRPYRQLLPHLRAVARRPRPLEGATKVDAILVAPSTGFAVVFEAKVLSDVSSHTTYDAIRNQIARNLDVLLDPHPALMHPLNTRLPARTCFVLLTPQIFLDNPHTRLYGSLMRDYRADVTNLERDLPHRDLPELIALSGRLGWTSWERVDELVPGACPWLSLT